MPSRLLFGLSRSQLARERRDEMRTVGTCAELEIDPTRQTKIGIALAGSILFGWLCIHILGVFVFEWTAFACIAAPILVVTQTWLYVGLFIVAHDCMHGSLVPFRPGLNRFIGQLFLFLYAGFDFDDLNLKHHAHHRHAGTTRDPDFDPSPPHGFWHWYVKFFSEYFGWRQVAVIATFVTLYLLVFGAALSNVLVFWALPALVSSLQLFIFGTYLPHRPGQDGFLDRHRARSNNFSQLISLLTCFHFGYHHEHHEHPQLPWWRLPLLKGKAT